MDLSKINISSYLPAMPYLVRDLVDKATNIVMNYSETETKVVEATNDESWGPPGKLLQEISQLSYSSEYYNEIMGMLWKRCLGQDKRYWRRTYKALLLLNYLLKNGSDKVITSTREHLYDLKSLETFTYHDEQNKDQGINIRHKVKELIEFVQDDGRLRDERKRARANRDKYIGLSNESSSYHYRSSEDRSHKPRKKSDEQIPNFKSISKAENVEVVNEKPLVDLLGDEIDDMEFGQFQEATTPVEPTSAPLWSSSDIFDPFASSDSSPNLFPTNDFHSFTNPPIATTHPITSTVSRTPTIEPANLWSSAQGKLDISLNNLIPHTRGDSQKSSLPLNQLTSPNNSNFQSQSVFANLNRK